MGYELRMHIGQLSLEMDEYKTSKDPIIDGGTLYYPPAKDENGEEIKTGRMERSLMQYAELDLCNVGDSAIGKLAAKAARKKKPPINYGVYVDGNNTKEQDSYGDYYIPVSLDDAIKALTKDTQDHDYRRFKWALALLKAMRETDKGDQIIILFRGH